QVGRVAIATVAATNPKTKIGYADFQPGYYPHLVNDIIAAKQYLDRRSDGGDCNSANLVVIGAEDGATLGALWLASECYLYRAPQEFPLKLEKHPELKDVACAVWLSMSPTLGK